MDKNANRISYRQGMSSQELGSYIKAVAIPIGVFLLSLLIIGQFGAFGRNILAPAASLMWIAGAAVALKIPSQRKSTLNETHAAVTGYLAGLMLLKWLIGVAATTSSEQLMATYSQALPVSTGSTISGFLQSMLWILSFMTPITFLTLQAKKFITFRRTSAKNKVMEQIRGIRER